MVWAVVPLLVLIAVLFWERRRRTRADKHDTYTPEEREMYFDELRRKRTSEMKKHEEP